MARRILQNPSVIALSGAVTLLMAVFLFPRSNQTFMGPGDPGIAELQLSWNADRFVEILNTWSSSTGDASVTGLRFQLLALDLLFPVAYAFFGSAVLATIWPPSTLPNWLLFGPIFAAVADLIENAFLLFAVADLPPIALASIPGWSVLGASLFSSVKFGLLAGSLSVMFVGLVRCWCQRGDVVNRETSTTTR